MSMHDDMELKRALDALPRDIAPPAEAWPAIRAKLRPAQSRRRGFRWPEHFEPATIRIAAGIAMIGIGLTYVGMSTRATSRWTYNAWSLPESPVVARRTAPLMTAIDRPLSAGSAIATDSRGWAQIRVGNFGFVNVWPKSDLKLLSARPVEQRMTLNRGGITAHIDAPPRLFIVQTPTGVVTDMGCAYDLQVDSAGSTTLRVSVGWVTLDNHGRVSLVPQGFDVTTPAGKPVGTPIRFDAPAALRNAVYRWDMERSDTAAAQAILGAARRDDAVTLWHMLPWLDVTQRAAAYTKLAGIARPPEGVTREGVLAGNQVMMRLWWEQLPGTLKIDTRIQTKLWTLWLKAASWL